MAQNPLDGNQVDNYDLGTPTTNTFEFRPGTCVLPVAEEPPTDPSALAKWSPVVVLQLHAPYRLRRTNYVAQKCNNPPVLPSPESIGAFVFVNGVTSITNTLNPSYVAFDWVAACDYLFVENCVSRTQDGLVLGTPPWQWITSETNGQTNAPDPTKIGAVASAGREVKVAATMGNSIKFDQSSQSPVGYFYNMPSYYPGTFFNNYLVNGGVPGGQT